MRCLALILVLALTGCPWERVRPTVPKIVRVEVPVIVDVPETLSRDCDPVAKKGNDYAEAIRLANARAESLAECSGRMKKIRELKR